MMISLKHLMNFSVVAKDGRVGSIHDFDFDDREWKVRKIITNPGSWRLAGKAVFAPELVSSTNWQDRQLALATSRAQLMLEDVEDEASSLAKNNDSTTMEKVEELSRFGTVPTVQNIVVSISNPMSVSEGEGNYIESEPVATGGEMNIMRAGDVFGYRVATNNGDLGSVEDFIVDDKTWHVRFLVIDACREAEGKRILVAPHLIDWVSWKLKKVSVSVDRQEIMSCPNFKLTAEGVQKELEPLFDAFECGNYLDQQSA